MAIIAPTAQHKKKPAGGGEKPAAAPAPPPAPKPAPPAQKLEG